MYNIKVFHIKINCLGLWNDISQPFSLKCLFLQYKDVKNRSNVLVL